MTTNAGPPVGTGGVLAPASMDTKLVSETRRVALGQGQRGELVVRVEDLDGAPREGVPVSFSLAGEARDSSLAALTVMSDEEGRARNSVLAGVMEATFSVLISVEGAQPIMVPAIVHPQGFGSLSTRAAYEGRHTPAMRTIYVYPDTTCRELADDAQTDNSAALGSGQDSASFFLPAGLSYAVRALAQASDGTTLAEACANSPKIKANEVSDLELSFLDAYLIPTGTFDVETTLHSRAMADAITDRLHGALKTRIDMTSESDTSLAGASYLLSALTRSLQTTAVLPADELMMLPATLADALLLGEIQASLDKEKVGPQLAVEALLDEVHLGLSTLSLSFTLDLIEDRAEVRSTLLLREVRGAAQGQAGTAGSVDLGDAPVDTGDLTHNTDDDTLALQAVPLSLPLGELSIQLLKSTIAANASLDSPLFQTMGCEALFDVFVPWAEATLPALSCDASCQQATCDRAFSNLVTAAEGSMNDIEALPALAGTLDATLQLIDQTGDLTPDAMSADDVTALFESAGGEIAAASSGELRGTLVSMVP